jgi:hypothetical protein
MSSGKIWHEVMEASFGQPAYRVEDFARPDGLVDVCRAAPGVPRPRPRRARPRGGALPALAPIAESVS